MPDGNFQKKLWGRRKIQGGFVYVLGSCEDRPKKIGVTQNLRMRLRVAQIYSPDELKYFYCRAFEEADFSFVCEQLAHHILEHRRIRGEWFGVTAEEAIEAIEAAHDLIVRKRDPFSLGSLKISAVKQWRRLYPDQGELVLDYELEQKIRGVLGEGETVAEFMRDAVMRGIMEREQEMAISKRAIA